MSAEQSAAAASPIVEVNLYTAEHAEANKQWLAQTYQLTVIARNAINALVKLIVDASTPLTDTLAETTAPRMASILDVVEGLNQTGQAWNELLANYDELREVYEKAKKLEDERKKVHGPQ